MNLKYNSSDKFEIIYNNLIMDERFGSYYELKDENKNIRKILKSGPYKYIFTLPNGKCIPKTKILIPLDINLPECVEQLGDGNYRINNLYEGIYFITALSLLNQHNLNVIKTLWLKNKKLK